MIRIDHLLFDEHHPSQPSVQIRTKFVFRIDTTPFDVAQMLVVRRHHEELLFVRYAKIRQHGRVFGVIRSTLILKFKKNGFFDTQNEVKD